MPSSRMLPLRVRWRSSRRAMRQRSASLLRNGVSADGLRKCYKCIARSSPYPASVLEYVDAWHGYPRTETVDRHQPLSCDALRVFYSYVAQAVAQ